jgi:hypothetical protein
MTKERTWPNAVIPDPRDETKYNVRQMDGFMTFSAPVSKRQATEACFTANQSFDWGESYRRGKAVS